jgi:hypothetical protein
MRLRTNAASSDSGPSGRRHCSVSLLSSPRGRPPLRSQSSRRGQGGRGMDLRSGHLTSSIPPRLGPPSAGPSAAADEGFRRRMDVAGRHRRALRIDVGAHVPRHPGEICRRSACPRMTLPPSSLVLVWGRRQSTSTRTLRHRARVGIPIGRSPTRRAGRQVSRRPESG